jgi:ubiquinone/menaquinone biosynthesis C-methylase UbiE
VLDVGCGLGHWTFLLASVLDPEAALHGIDIEPDWVERAEQRAAEFGLSARARFSVADATALPFEDGSFDLVTCQTVLMHLEDPHAAVREMARVTKPGGAVLASEPNNAVAELMVNSVDVDAPIEEVLDRVRFRLLRERGKQALGEGNESIGNLIPGYFAQAGLQDISTVISQKTPTVYPPYASDEQQVLIAHALDPETWIGDPAETRRYFLAAGRTEDEFGAAWERRLAEQRRIAEAISNRTFHTTGGFVLYLTAARKQPS